MQGSKLKIPLRVAYFLRTLDGRSLLENAQAHSSLNSGVTLGGVFLSWCHLKFDEVDNNTAS
jgi:hypothetical protein